MRITGDLANIFLVLLEMLKFELPEEEAAEGGAVEPIIPVVNADGTITTPTPTPEQQIIIEQILDDTFPSPVVLLEDLTLQETIIRDRLETIPEEEPVISTDRTLSDTYYRL